MEVWVCGSSGFPASKWSQPGTCFLLECLSVDMMLRWSPQRANDRYKVHLDGWAIHYNLVLFIGVSVLQYMSARIALLVHWQYCTKVLASSCQHPCLSCFCYIQSIIHLAQNKDGQEKDQHVQAHHLLYHLHCGTTNFKTTVRAYYFVTLNPDWK